MKYKHSPGPWFFCGTHVDDSKGKLLLDSGRNFERTNCADLLLASEAPNLLDTLVTVREQLLNEFGNTVFNANFSYIDGAIDRAVNGDFECPG